jgi:hypothetical protein
VEDVEKKEEKGEEKVEEGVRRQWKVCVLGIN